MKKIGLVVLSILLFSGCISKTDKKDLLPNSYGRMGSLAVVIDNDLWKGKVGDAVRDIFAAETIGLPQVEPLFSILQMPYIKQSARKNHSCGFKKKLKKEVRIF